VMQLRGEEYPPPAPPAEGSVAVSGAAPSDAVSDVPPNWTGAVIYCQPGCVPCATQIRDLRKSGWKCGVGDGNHFKIVELLSLSDFQKRGVPSTPQTVYFIDGAEQAPRVTGYGGTSAELTALVNRHPKVKRSARLGTAMQPPGCTCLLGGVCACNGNCHCAPLVSTMSPAMSYGTSPLWYDASAHCGAPALASDCGSPAMAANCGSPAIGYSAPIVTSVMYSDPVVYRAPVYVPAYANSGVTIGPATHSAGISLFGFPIIGGSIGTTLNW
jgi:hypothetical protein